MKRRIQENFWAESPIFLPISNNFFSSIFREKFSAFALAKFFDGTVVCQLGHFFVHFKALGDVSSQAIKFWLKEETSYTV